jgi:hypothetical protein
MVLFPIAPKMESNPKNYFRVGDEKFNSLIKSPMKSVLGQPSSKLSTKQISDFVALVKGECNIPDVDVKFAKSMTDFYTSTFDFFPAPVSGADFFSFLAGTSLKQPSERPHSLTRTIWRIWSPRQERTRFLVSEKDGFCSGVLTLFGATVWGKTAFEAADEQIGIGQLEDSTLPANMIIIEDRSGASSGPHAVPGIVADWKLKNPSPCFT